MEVTLFYLINNRLTTSTTTYVNFFLLSLYLSSLKIQLYLFLAKSSHHIVLVSFPSQFVVISGVSLLHKLHNCITLRRAKSSPTPFPFPVSCVLLCFSFSALL